MFKNVMENKEENVEGYCFVDEDNLEVRVSIPHNPFRGSFLVDITTDDNEEMVVIYHKDIPKLIKVLEAAYNHKD